MKLLLFLIWCEFRFRWRTLLPFTLISSGLIFSLVSIITIFPNFGNLLFINKRTFSKTQTVLRLQLFLFIGQQPQSVLKGSVGRIQILNVDCVIFLYRDEYYKTDTANEAEGNIAEVIVAKNRHGSTGTVKVGWIGRYTKFRSIAESGSVPEA